MFGYSGSGKANQGEVYCRRPLVFFFRFFMDCFFCGFVLPAGLDGFFFDSAGISPGSTNIGRDRRSRLAGLASRAILSSGSVSYRTPRAR